MVEFLEKSLNEFSVKECLRFFFFDNIPKNPGCISETIFKNNFEECLEKYQDQFLEKNR